MVDKQKRESERFCSVIQTSLLNRALKRGSWLGGSGAVLIILCGTFLPLSLLKLLGIPVFLTGIFLIGIGLYPYKKLSRLQIKPHEVVIDSESLVFHQGGKPLFQLPCKNIQRIQFFSQESLYGIKIWLIPSSKSNPKSKIKVLQKEFDFASFMADSAERFEGCDLFLPYFTEKSERGFKDLLE